MTGVQTCALPISKEIYSIERIDNNIGYMSGNVKWIKASEQALNKSNNIMIDYKGSRLPLSVVCRDVGTNLNPSTVRKRLLRGVPVDQALNIGRAKVTRKFIYNNGERISLSAFIKKYGLSESFVHKAYSEGLTGDDILICPEAYKGNSPYTKKLEYNGMSLSRQKWAEYLGVNSTTIKIN